MNRFVKAFRNDHQHMLEKNINEYAKQNNLKIVQVSYSAYNERFGSDRALVLFEKINEHTNIYNDGQIEELTFWGL